MAAPAYWICWIILTRFLASPLVGIFPSPFFQLITGCTGCLTAAACYLLLKKTLPLKRNSVTPGLRKITTDFIFGLVIGTVIFGTFILILTYSTQLSFQRVNSHFTPGSVVSLVGLIPLALMEEMSFRGRPYRQLEQACRTVPAVIVCAIAFALYHVSAKYNLATAFSGPFLWAFVFSLGAIWSKGIAFPTGMHVMLNAGQMILGMKGEYGALYAPILSSNSTDATKRTEILGLAIIILLAILSLMIIIRMATKSREIYSQQCAPNNFKS